VNRVKLWSARLWQPHGLGQWVPVVLIIGGSLVLGLGGEEIRAWARYERTALNSGELWRLITAHLVHLSWGHLWLNLTALGLMALLFQGLLRAGDWVLAGMLGALSIDAGLYAFNAEIQWYVGLSGVLHGLLFVGAFGLSRSRSRLGYILLLGLAGKLLWEQTSGPLPFSESSSGGPVVVDAHLYGTLGGVVTPLMKHLTRRLSA